MLKTTTTTTRPPTTTPSRLMYAIYRIRGDSPYWDPIWSSLGYDTLETTTGYDTLESTTLMTPTREPGNVDKVVGFTPYYVGK